MTAMATDKLAAEMLAGLKGVTPGPWSHCSAKRCTCTGILGKDHPVAEIVKGEWGDEFPSLRFKEGGKGQLGETSVEAYMEKIVYGEISIEMAMANRAHIARCSPDNIRALLEERSTDKATISALEAENKRLADTIQSVLTWADQRCPCHNEQPNPCPLCGASVENLEACKSAENTFPRRLLSEIRDTLRRARDLSRNRRETP